MIPNTVIRLSYYKLNTDLEKSDWERTHVGKTHHHICVMDEAAVLRRHHGGALAR